MPRTRAYRRHKRLVKLRRRWRILENGEQWSGADWLRAVNYRGPDPRDMNAHIRCGCMDDPREHGRGRRTIEGREWRAFEERVSA